MRVRGTVGSGAGLAEVVRGHGVGSSAPLLCTLASGADGFDRSTICQVIVFNLPPNERIEVLSSRKPQHLKNVVELFAQVARDPCVSAGRKLRNFGHFDTLSLVMSLSLAASRIAFEFESFNSRIAGRVTRDVTEYTPSDTLCQRKMFHRLDRMNRRVETEIGYSEEIP